MLFDAVSPHIVCKDLGFKMFIDKNSMSYVKDPHNNCQITILTREFVSKNFNINFQYGNIIDFIVYAKGGSYIEAVDFILEKYEDKLSESLLSSVRWVRQDIADYLQDLNTINKRLLKLQQNKKILDSARQYLEAKSFMWAGDSQFVITCTGSDIHDLFSDLVSNEFSSRKNLNVATSKHNPILKANTFILYPYYVDYHTISAIVVENLETSRFDTLYESAFTHGYLGYHTIPPHVYTAILCDDIEDITHIRKRVLDHGYTKYGTVLVRNNCAIHGKSSRTKQGGPVIPRKLPRGIVSIGKIQQLHKIMEYFKYAEDVRYSKDILYQNFLSSGCCRQAIVSGFFKLFEKDPGDEQSLSKYLSLAFKDSIIKSVLVDKINCTGNSDLLAWSDDSVFGKRKSTNALGCVVNYTDNGYILEKDGDAIPLTNYILLFKTCIMFKNSSDVFYSGKLFIAGQSLDIIVPKRYIQNNSSLLKHLTLCISQNPAQLRAPATFEKNYVKYITATLLQEAGSAKVTFGTANIGWNEDRTEFLAPGWCVTRDVILPNANPLHYEIDTFSKFSHVEILRSGDLVKGNDSKTLMCLLTSVLCRTYMGWDVPSIEVKDTPTNRRFIKIALSVFGQKSLIEVNTNARRRTVEITGLSGYVVYCNGFDAPEPFYKNGLFYFSEDGGLDFLQEEDPDLLSSYLKFYIPYLIKHIISTGCVGFHKISDTIHALIQEGVSYNRALLSMPDFNCVDLINGTEIQLKRAL